MLFANEEQFMSHRLRLFILEYNFSMSAYWICTGFLIAKLTQYYNLPLGLSNLLTFPPPFWYYSLWVVCSTPGLITSIVFWWA